MVKINIWANASAKTESTPAPKKISFGSFNETSVKRDTAISSIPLALKDIIPFEDNVRIEYDEEALSRLKQSIKENGNIWNIDVVHIVHGDKYIIADGHRTHRAYLDLYWPDHIVDVIVRKEYPEYSQQVEIDLMSFGFITSNLKENLSVYEQLESVQKFLEKLDKSSPEKAPHKISQKEVYEKLGFWKSNAIKINKVLENIPREEFVNMKDLDISRNTLIETSKIKDENIRSEVIEQIKKENIKSVEEVNAYQTIAQNPDLDDFWDTDEDEDTSIKKTDKQKREEKFLDTKNPKTPEDKIIKDLVFSSWKIIKSLMIIYPAKLTDTQLSEVIKTLENLQKAIKSKPDLYEEKNRRGL